MSGSRMKRDCPGTCTSRLSFSSILVIRLAVYLNEETQGSEILSQFRICLDVGIESWKVKSGFFVLKTLIASAFGPANHMPP